VALKLTLVKHALDEPGHLIHHSAIELAYATQTMATGARRPLVLVWLLLGCNLRLRLRLRRRQVELHCSCILLPLAGCLALELRPPQLLLLLLERRLSRRPLGLAALGRLLLAGQSGLGRPCLRCRRRPSAAFLALGLLLLLLGFSLLAQRPLRFN